jgi:hypothetical protein
LALAGGGSVAASGEAVAVAVAVPQGGTLVGVGAMEMVGSVAASRWTMEPPGDCTERQHKVLKDAVTQNCKTPESARSCDPQRDVCLDVVRAKIANVYRCIDARKTIMNTCYRGGDYIHMRLLATEMGVLHKCLKIESALLREGARMLPKG